MARRKKHDQETQERAVRMVKDRVATGESMLCARETVGEMLGVNPSTLRHWLEGSRARQAPTSTELTAEVEALRRENAQLRQANEILKTASAFFAQAELDRRLQ